MSQEYEIQIIDENADNLSLDLIEFLRSESIDELQSVALAQGSPEDGKMGLEIFDKIKMIIESANKPLTTLANALLEWVRGRKTTIDILLPDGTHVKLDGNNIKGAENLFKAMKP